MTRPHKQSRTPSLHVSALGCCSVVGRYSFLWLIVGVGYICSSYRPSFFCLRTHVSDTANATSSNTVRINTFNVCCVRSIKRSERQDVKFLRHVPPRFCVPVVLLERLKLGSAHKQPEMSCKALCYPPGGLWVTDCVFMTCLTFNS